MAARHHSFPARTPVPGKARRQRVKFVSTPVRIEEKSITGPARRKGGLIGMLMVRAPLTTLRLEYKKYYRFSFPYRIYARIFLTRRREIAGEIEIIVDAVTGKCAVNDSTTIELVESSGKLFMDGTFDMDIEEAGNTALEFAKRIVSRIGRSVPTFGAAPEPEYFYRPIWAAYYGDPQDKTCRYLPFEADGHTFKR